jgi:YbbR domain-containing protein
MVVKIVRRIWDNLGTLILAFLLAMAVWISAVIDSDPNKEQYFPGDVTLEIIEEDLNLIRYGAVPEDVRVRIHAPESIWNLLMSVQGAVQAVVDFSGLGPGEYIVPVRIDIDPSFTPVQLIEFSPSEIEITLEALISKEFTIRSIVEGEPALGFHLDQRSISQSRVIISGPQSLVEQVDEVQAELNLNNARESITEEITLRPVDASGNRVVGITLEPESVVISQIILQTGGYRDLAVSFQTTGEPAAGYRVTGVSVSPQIVTVFSSDPSLVDEFPGFVHTYVLDLTGANDDIETRLGLDLPDGVSVVGEQQSVLVLVSIKAIEGSTTMTLPVEVIGLSAGFEAEISPQNVAVFLSGPLIVLEGLVEGDVRIFVDLTDLEIGTYQLVPTEEILPDRVVIDSMSPAVIEVNITIKPTPTITPTPETLPDQFPTSSPIATSTATPNK